MTRFTTGFIIGTTLAAAGIGYALYDSALKRKVLRQSRKAVKRAGWAMEEFADNHLR
ncbi:MAG: hypothetical protein IJC39_03240 [Firmicutes bacterium]|nr:hypothetical protein [Bacillota bacterium]